MRRLVTSLRLNHITPHEVALAPKPLLPGIIYISHNYRVALHMCCCGCGEKVVTPLSAAEWQVNLHNGQVSLYPSVGSGTACRSHYWIEEGRVVWTAPMTSQQIARTRQNDRASLEAMYAARRHARLPRWAQGLVSAFTTAKNWFSRR